MQRLRRVAAVACASAVLIAGQVPASGQTAEYQVQASFFRFCKYDFPLCPFYGGEYRTLVRAGTEVVWYYNDPLCDAIVACPGHNVTFSDEEEPAPTIKGSIVENAELRRVRFEEPGRFYSYACRVHDGMTGWISVI